MPKKRSGKKWLAGLGTIAIIMTFVIALALWNLISLWIDAGVEAYGLLPMTGFIILVITAFALLFGVGINGAVKKITK